MRRKNLGICRHPLHVERISEGLGPTGTTIAVAALIVLGGPIGFAVFETLSLYSQVPAIIFFTTLIAVLIASGSYVYVMVFAFMRLRRFRKEQTCGEK